MYIIFDNRDKSGVKMLHILLTFDYELFFNESYCSEKEILIDSTEVIRKALDKEEIKATFFVDTPCVYRYKEIGQDLFPTMVEQQVNELLDDKHDIQLHLHPSWFKAQYEGEKWKFEQNDYSLDKHDNPVELIKKAKYTLDSLAGSNSNYNCCAYRAGGFCLSPEEEILNTLYRLGIVFDSSVCCGVKMESVAQTYDWTGIRRRGQWCFNPLEGVRSIGSNSCVMIEIPVGTFAQIPQKWSLTHGHPKLNYPPFKGKASPVEEIRKRNKIERIKDRLVASFTTPVLFSMDSLHFNALYKIAQDYMTVSQKENREIYICAIAHPKFSSNESVENMLQFIKKVRNHQKNGIDFITFSDAYNRLDIIRQ